MQYKQEEVEILRQLVLIMQQLQLTPKYIHVLNEILRRAVLDNSEGWFERCLCVGADDLIIARVAVEPEMSYIADAAIRDFKRVGVLQVWNRGMYRLNPELFGRRPWYTDGTPQTLNNRRNIYEWFCNRKRSRGFACRV